MSQLGEPVHFVYHGPNDMAMPVSVPNALVVKCTLRQLVLSSINMRVDQLQTLCQVHNINGYSPSRSRAKEIFLHVLLWICEPGCAAYFIDPAPRNATEQFGVIVDALQKEVHDRQEKMQRDLANQSAKRAASIADRSAENDKPTRRTPRASQAPEPTHYTPASAQLQAEIRTDWNEYFNDANFRIFCCLVCSERVFGHEVQWVSEGDIKCEDRGILEVLTDVHLRSDLRPTTYDFEEWRSAIIDPRGLHRANELKGQQIYSATDQPVQYHLPPDVKACFSTASQLELLVTARARAYKIVYEITKFGNPNTQQKCTRGNTLILSQNTASFTEILPMSVEQLADSVCILFCGAKANLAELDKCRPMIVRQEKVKRMVEWLIHDSQNPAYCGLHFEDSRLAELVGYSDSSSSSSSRSNASASGSAAGAPGPDPPRPLVLVPETLVSNAIQGESVEAATSLFEGYATTNNESDEPIFEPVHVPPPPTDHSVHSWEFFEKALRHFRQNKPTYIIPSGETPLWESTDELLLSKLWPHLDPYGLVGFCLDRDVSISLDQQVQHWLNLYDPGFRCDPTFPFIVSNMLRRRDVFRQLVFRVSEDRINRIARTLQDIDLTVLSEMEEKRIERVLADLQSVGDKIHGSTAQMIDMRNEIRGYVTAFGMYTLFITVNPADIHSPLILKIGGHDINLNEDLLEAFGYSASRRAQIVAADPASAAQMFDTTIKAFLKFTVRAADKDKRRGLFGKHVAHFGIVETQMRGTLHSHMLLWLDGHPSSNDFRSRIGEDPETQRQLIDWIDSLTLQGYPGQTEHDMNRNRELGTNPKRPPPGTEGKPHPALRRPPEVASKDFDQYIIDLANAFQFHVHNSSCVKNQRPSVVATDGICRYRINGETRAETVVDLDTGKIEPKRLEPKLNGYNPLCPELLKCNTDVVFAEFGKLGRVILFYVTLYMTKGSLPLGEAYDAVHVALRR
ncbi:BQ2448_388 [Microbotryum intermedium]|uniref:BQ2448_388 protein n=1 Tax=Microbotryum intermedium TaxID=269621 RepID=A0A238F5G7_9BASI|nr:BQ2448_388 [Microbotryum intermedium]